MTSHQGVKPLRARGPVGATGLAVRRGSPVFDARAFRPDTRPAPWWVPPWDCRCHDPVVFGHQSPCAWWESQPVCWNASGSVRSLPDPWSLWITE